MKWKQWKEWAVRQEVSLLAFCVNLSRCKDTFVAGKNFVQTMLCVYWFLHRQLAPAAWCQNKLFLRLRKWRAVSVCSSTGAPRKGDTKRCPLCSSLPDIFQISWPAARSLVGKSQCVWSPWDFCWGSGWGMASFCHKGPHAPQKTQGKQLHLDKVINIVSQFTQNGLFYVKTLHTTGLKW